MKNRTSLSFFVFTGGVHENLCILLSVPVFFYICFRAAVISISHDEALTYLIHVLGNPRDVINYLLPQNSNNHLLNTLLIKVFIRLFGNSEFVIRLPAIIGGLFFLGGTFKLLKLFLTRTALFLSYTAIITCPIFLDFFSCGRGYGLGLGLMMVGLYLILKRSGNNDAGARREYWMAVLLLTLSVFSNLVFANVFLPLLGMVITTEIYYYRKSFSSWRIFLGKLYAVLVPIFLGVGFLRFIYSAEVMHRIQAYLTEWGGTRGFWADTVTSALEGFFYGKDYAVYPVILLGQVLIFILYAISAFVAVAAAARRRFSARELQLLSWIVCLLFLIGTVMAAQFHFMKIKYATERATLYVTALFMLMIAMLLGAAQLIQQRAVKTMCAGLLQGLLLLIIVHNAACLNVTYYYYWRYDADTKKAMAMIRDATIGKKKSTGEIRIGISWLFDAASYFYIKRDGLYWLQKTNRESPDAIYDFYYLLEEDKAVIEKRKLKILKYFPVSMSYLAVPERI